MQDPSMDRSGPLPFFNAISLQNAVLCAECDCVTDSPHDKCLVCGSRSLFNISRVLGGSLLRTRTVVIEHQGVQPAEKVAEIVLNLPRPHRIRNKVAA